MLLFSSGEAITGSLVGHFPAFGSAAAAGGGGLDAPRFPSLSKKSGGVPATSQIRSAAYTALP